MKTPKKITPCPIQEAVVEIRFNSEMPPDAIFGIIYNEFKTDFPKTVNLPILQIPEAIRFQDPNLLYKPYYKLTNDMFILQIGPKVISLINPKDYVGWAKFSKIMIDSIKRINKLEVLGPIIRLGIRYINFFEFDIFDKINLDLLCKGKRLESKHLFIQTILETGEFESKLRVSNNAEVKQQKISKRGSIIDIDTVLTKEGITVKEIIGNLIESGHTEEKNLFFSLLKEDFIKTLNAEY